MSIQITDKREIKLVGGLYTFSKTNPTFPPRLEPIPPVTEIFRSAAENALVAHGFEISSDPSLPTMHIELMHVEMSHVTGFWTGRYEYEVAIKSTSNNGEKWASKEFRSIDAWGGVLVPSPKYYSMLSDQISKVVDQMVADQSLISVLVRKDTD